MSDDKKSEEHIEDSELNDLLDSALEDFNKSSTLDVKDDDGATSKSVPSTDTEQATSVDVDDLWSQDFLKQAGDLIKKDILPEGSEAYQRMAQALADLVDAQGNYGDSVKADFQSAIALGLEDLSITSENLQNEPDIASMFSQVSLEEGAGDILPFMQGMMQSLLSKEILYPSLKELVDKYPEWLEQKKDTLSSGDLQRYTKQLELMQKVCSELEKEQDTDTDEIKKRRFETILSLMQDMQTYGQPPEELVGEQPALFQFDAEGNPIVPALPPGVEVPQNCCIM
ncbi:hypothetical protein KPH14_010974 [Odynerus spinipes]|uniref:Peroxin-19 n=1 Tax=Odynerus spinipes TaxID=1348599 RepID=A0AAD9RW38_9HYME|nr:hypothetical protein KPH14_010974 [Odynerus spinipes]